MIQKPLNCEGCQLCKIGQGFTHIEEHFQSITNGVKLYMVGEYPQWEEIIDGMPFIQRSQGGSMLNHILKREGINRNKFDITTMIRCAPPDKYPINMEMIKYCGDSYLEDVLLGNLAQGIMNVIIAFDDISLRYLTDFSGSMKNKESVDYLGGFVLKSRFGLVIPTYSPIKVRKGLPHYIPIVGNHIQRAIDVANHINNPLIGSIIHPFHTAYQPPVYNEYPSIDDVEGFANRVEEINIGNKEGRKIFLGYDIETPHSKLFDEEERELIGNDPIIMIQFALEKNTGIAVPWAQEYLSAIKRIMGSNVVKAGFNNWDFDNPKIIGNKIDIRGSNFDLMWLFHRWQGDLDMNLQFVASYCGFPFPWKHLFGNKLNYYACADVDSLHWILPLLYKKMKNKVNSRGVSVWDNYMEGVYKRKPQFDSIVGYPVDEVEREKVGEWLDKEILRVNEELQELVPLELRNIEKKRKRKEVLTKERIARLKEEMVKNKSLPLDLSEEELAQELGITETDTETNVEKSLKVKMEKIKKPRKPRKEKISGEELLKMITVQKGLFDGEGDEKDYMGVD